MSILIILQCNANIKNLQTQKQRIFTNEHDDTQNTQNIKDESYDAQNTQNIKDESYDAQNKQTEETSKVKTYKAHKIIGVIGLLLCAVATILIVKNHATESNSLKTKMQDLFTNRHTKQINEYIMNFEIIKDIGTKLGIKDIDTLKQKNNTEINDLLWIIQTINNVRQVVSYDDSIFNDDINTIKTMATNKQKQYKFKSKSQINRILQATNKDDILYEDLYYLYDKNNINVLDLYEIKQTAEFLNIPETTINKDSFKDVETVYKKICNKANQANLLTLYNSHNKLFDYDDIIMIKNRDGNVGTISITEWESKQGQINSMNIFTLGEEELLNYITDHDKTIHLSTFIINKNKHNIYITNLKYYSENFFIHSSIFDALITILKAYNLKVIDER